MRYPSSPTSPASRINPSSPSSPPPSQPEQPGGANGSDTPETGTLESQFRVGFITPPFKDSQIPVKDHLHAHAYVAPMDRCGWWRSVAYSPIAWYAIEDLIAEIRCVFLRAFFIGRFLLCVLVFALGISQALPVTLFTPFDHPLKTRHKGQILPPCRRS